jgi:hypothetical protein
MCQFPWHQVLLGILSLELKKAAVTPCTMQLASETHERCYNHRKEVATS